MNISKPSITPAALLTALFTLAQAAVALVGLGPAVLTNMALLAEVACSNPAPLVVIECLKIAAAISSLPVVLALHQRLRPQAPRLARMALAAGILSAALLGAAGLAGLLALAQATGLVATFTASYAQATQAVNLIGLLALVAGGVWVLLNSVVALRSGGLPRTLALLGVVHGLASLAAPMLPALTMLVLLLGLVWWVWLGIGAGVLADRPVVAAGV